MTPSPAQPPFAAVPARPGASTASDGSSQAAGAFAILLAGVLPMPAAAAAPAPLGASDAVLDAGARSPGAGLPNGIALPAAGQGVAPPMSAGTPMPQAPATDGLAIDQPTALPGKPTAANATRGAGPTPGIVGPAAAGQPLVAAGQPSPANDLPDSIAPARPSAPNALAAPVAATADDEFTSRPRAGPQLANAAAIDHPMPETATRLPGHERIVVAAAAATPTSGDRPASTVIRSSPPALAPSTEPDPDAQPMPAAPEPGSAVQGTAPKPRLPVAAVSQSPAPADARIEPPAEIAAAAPGRAERAANEPPAPARQPPPQAPALQLGIQIATAASRHVERLVVHLEPAALGRVEVRLDFSHDHRVSALIAADRPETLELLQRDSRALERGLQDAGLRLDQDGLSFSLRQEQRGHERGAGPPGPWPRLEPATGPASHANHADDARPAHWIGADRVLDIRI